MQERRIMRHSFGALVYCMTYWWCTPLFRLQSSSCSSAASSSAGKPPVVGPAGIQWGGMGGAKAKQADQNPVLTIMACSAVCIPDVHDVMCILIYTPLKQSCISMLVASPFSPMYCISLFGSVQSKGSPCTALHTNKLPLSTLCRTFDPNTGPISCVC